jgi:hypothetical protein
MITKKIFLVFTLLLLVINVKAQIGYGTSSPNPNSVLHLYSQDSTKGLIIPAVSTAKRPAAVAALSGMMVYNVTDNCMQFCNGTKWVCLDSVGPDVDSLKFINDTLYLYEDDKLFTNYINPSSDTALIDSLILASSDTLYSIVSDSLLDDNVFLDSLVAKIKDSIDTDVDSIKVSNDTLFIYEDGFVVKSFIGEIDEYNLNAGQGNSVAYGPSDVQAWNAQTGTWSNSSFSGNCDSVVTSNGNFLAYGPSDVQAWNAQTGTWSNSSFSGNCVGVAKFNGYFVAYGPSDVQAWNAQTGTWSNSSFSGNCDSVVRSKGNFVAYGPSDVQAWNVQTGTWSNSSFSGNCVGVVYDEGSFVAYGPSDVQAWNAQTGNWANSSFSGNCAGVVISKGNFIAYGPSDLQAWSLVTVSWVNSSFSGNVVGITPD